MNLQEYVSSLNHSVNRSNKLEITKDLKQSLVVFLLEYQSILMFAHQVEHVVDSLSVNFELGL